MSQNEIFFSVVIPLFNKEKYIKDAINSVLSQTIENFELIIVNDGSTDNSPQIVKNLKDKRITLISKENEGVSVARNTGILKSSAKYIAFLDADDEWLPDFLETIAGLIIRHPNAKSFATGTQRENKQGNLYDVTFSTLPSPPWEGVIDNLFKVMAHDSTPITSSSVCIQKDALIEIGMFPVGVKRGEDLDTWIRLFLKYQIAFITTPKAIIHNDRGGGSLAILKNVDEESFVVLELEKRLRANEVKEQYKEDAKKTISRSLSFKIDDLITTKQYSHALNIIFDKRMKRLPMTRNRLFLKLIVKYFTT